MIFLADLFTVPVTECRNFRINEERKATTDMSRRFNRLIFRPIYQTISNVMEGIHAK